MPTNPRRGRVVGVDADSDVLDAVAVMSRATLKSLPVLRQGRVVGMLSRSDIARTAAERDARQPAPLLGC